MATYQPCTSTGAPRPPTVPNRTLTKRMRDRGSGLRPHDYATAEGNSYREAKPDELEIGHWPPKRCQLARKGRVGCARGGVHMRPHLGLRHFSRTTLTSPGEGKSTIE